MKAAFLYCSITFFFLGNSSTICAETIHWCNTQWPPYITHIASSTTPTDNIYGQAYIDGETDTPGATTGLIAQAGYGGSDNPSEWTNWVDAIYNVDVGNNDEFVTSLIVNTPGTYHYAYRFWFDAGNDGVGAGPWCYGYLNGDSLGVLNVLPSSQVPLPATMLLVGSGLLGLAGMKRRFKKTWPSSHH